MLEIIKTKKFWVEFFIMTFGMFWAAIAIHCFLLPSKIIIGSLAGLAMVICELFPWLSLSLATFIINAILLLLALVLIGKEFGAKTIYTALVLSPWLYILEEFLPIKESLMQDDWLDLLCFVIILSAVQALLFRINASTGGLDIIAKIMNKFWGIDMGNSVAVTGMLICSTAFFINDFKMVVIGLIGTWINGLVLNHFTAGLNQKKRLCIIAKDHESIKNFIVQELEIGATMYEVVGAYTNQKSTEIVVLLTRDEFASLMKFIEQNNIKALITAGNVNEVYGLWSKPKKRKFFLK